MFIKKFHFFIVYVLQTCLTIYILNWNVGTLLNNIYMHNIKFYLIYEYIHVLYQLVLLFWLFSLFYNFFYLDDETQNIFIILRIVLIYNDFSLRTGELRLTSRASSPCFISSVSSVFPKIIQIWIQCYDNILERDSIKYQGNVSEKKRSFNIIC